MEDRPAGSVSAFILAGGKSTRMGRDKAFLEFGGQTLLARALVLARSASSDVRIVGGAEKFSRFATVVEDEFRGRGPLSGIHAALRSSKTDLNLILAVDMPLVSTSFLEYLTAEARKSPNLLAVVPRTGGRNQTLCAIYRRGFFEPAERSLRAGENRIDCLFAPGTVRLIDEEELRRAGFSEDIFRNLNTPAEVESANISLHEGAQR